MSDLDFTIEKTYSWLDLPWYKRWFRSPKNGVISTYTVTLNDNCNYRFDPDNGLRCFPCSHQDITEKG